MNADSLLPVVFGRRIPITELCAAFDRVKDATRWKNPINATIPELNKEEELIMGSAITFYTGSVATFTALDENNFVQVKADGYYVAIGA